MIIYPVENEISSHCLIPQEYDLRMRYLSHSLNLRMDMIKPRLLCGRTGSKHLISVAYFVVVILLACNAAEADIGISWGRQTTQRLLPSQVVDLILQNGITQARIFTAQTDILNAFKGSGIKLTITLFSLGDLDTDEKARTWVEDRIQFFEASNVWRINVGNLAFNLGRHKSSKDLALSLAPFERLQNAINNASYGKNIKLTIQYNTAALLKDNITKPSEADFRDEIKEEMMKVISILQANDSPFVIETFPIPRITSQNWDIDFAFFDNKSKRVINDVHGAVYTNYFEFEYDSVLWALEKMGAPNLRLVVGIIGWPTDGDEAANATMAERFYKGLLPFIASNKGTPKRPGAEIDIYVHGLTDENKIPYQTNHYPFMRHWGIYRTNGKPKYKIDLSGQGRDMFPVELKEIQQMPARWCKYSGNARDPETLQRWINYACYAADCTSTWPGGSCGSLNFDQNVSYVFNMFFQSMFQDEKACPTIYELAELTTVDPSTGTCVFPVEVVRGHQDQFINQFLNKDGTLMKNATTMGGMRTALSQGNRIRDINVPAGRLFAIIFVFWIFNLRPFFSEYLFSM